MRLIEVNCPEYLLMKFGREWIKTAENVFNCKFMNIGGMIKQESA